MYMQADYGSSAAGNLLARRPILCPCGGVQHLPMSMGDPCFRRVVRGLLGGSCLPAWPPILRSSRISFARSHLASGPPHSPDCEAAWDASG